MNQDQKNRYRSRPVDLESSKTLPSTSFAGSINPAPAAKPEPDKIAPPHALKSKKARNYKLPVLVVASIALLAAVGGGYLLHRTSANSPNNHEVLGKSTQPSQAKVSKYLPSNLPAGFTYNNDYKQIKTNVFYFTINGPKANKFYITIQPIPANFDFNAFGAKFLKPDQYTVSIGSALAGKLGADLIASIRTTTDTWIIINASDTNDLAQLETVSRSLRQTPL